MTRYVHSVVRFVPDPVRGEFVNIGALVGSEDSGEWELRIIVNPRRARALDDRGIFRAVWQHVNDLEALIERSTEPTDVVAGTEPARVELSETWLTQLWAESNNILQFSRPAPILADSLPEALRIVFEEFIHDPESRRFHFLKKTTAVAQVKRSYDRHGLIVGRDLGRKAEVRGQNHKGVFDFVVWNGRAVQLVQAWSFQIPQTAETLEDVKAWAWTVHDIRRSGGRAEAPGRDGVDVPRDVDIQVSYVPPIEAPGRHLLGEALAAFEEINVTAVAADDSEQIARKAEELLGRGGRLH